MVESQDFTATLTEDANYEWNKLHNSMKYFHDYFKAEFNRIYKLADSDFDRAGNSLRRYLDEADSLKKHLEGHHMLEESFLFPILATRMRSFSRDEEHTQSHKAIHEGLVRLASLTREFRENPETYKAARIRECLDSFK